MTCTEAQDKIYEALRIRGWYHSRPELKIRWVKPTEVSYYHEKIWFKPQSLWKGSDRPENNLWIDIKKLAKHEPREIELFVRSKLR